MAAQSAVKAKFRKRERAPASRVQQDDTRTLASTSACLASLILPRMRYLVSADLILSGNAQLPSVKLLLWSCEKATCWPCPSRLQIPILQLPILRYLPLPATSWVPYPPRNEWHNYRLHSLLPSLNLRHLIQPLWCDVMWCALLWQTDAMQTQSSATASLCALKSETKLN